MDRHSSTFWENQFKKFESSGLTKAEFCDRNKLDRNSFFNWQKKIRPDLQGRKLPKKTQSESSFISLKEKVSEKVLIKLSSGIELTCSTETSPRWIANFLRELEATHA